MRASRFGCFLMFVAPDAKRLAQRARGLAAGPTMSRTRSRPTESGHRNGLMAFIFIAILLAGVPVFIALAGASFIYTHFIAGFPDFVILHRMAGGIDSSRCSRCRSSSSPAT